MARSTPLVVIAVITESVVSHNAKTTRRGYSDSSGTVGYAVVLERVVFHFTLNLVSRIQKNPIIKVSDGVVREGVVGEISHVVSVA